MTMYGAQVKYNTAIEHIDEIKGEYDATIIAIGASAPGVLNLENGDSVNALEFLANFKQTDGKPDVGKNVVVIGGGNTAMDTARAAKRAEGVQKVSLVYRRTKRYMPADEEELIMAMEDGVEFRELLAPKSCKDGVLICEVMKLADMDSSGRRGVVSTGETVEVPADTVIAAVGEKVCTDYYENNGIAVNEWGYAKVNPETLETGIKGIYIIGDGLGGPATVVEGIRDAKIVAEAIAGKTLFADFKETACEEDIYNNRGMLKDDNQSGRCLSCSTICENCAEVCPNRANVAIAVEGMEMHQIIHIDYMCNECGNCKSFCPYNSAPYLDKFTLFASQADMEDSKNDGFAVISKEDVTCKVRYLGVMRDMKSGDDSNIPVALKKIIETVCKEEDWLLL